MPRIRRKIGSAGIDDPAVALHQCRKAARRTFAPAQDETRTRHCSLLALHEKHALATHGLIKESVGFRSLIEPPAIGVDSIDVDAARRDEFRAFRLADRRKCPRAE